MAKNYSFDVDGELYILNSEEQYWTLLRALNILKTVAFLDNKIDGIMGNQVLKFTKDGYVPVDVDLFEFSVDEEQNYIEYGLLTGYMKYRESLEAMYKSLAKYLPDNLKDLISSEGIPYCLFHDNRMSLEYHLPCMEMGAEIERYISDSSKEFYVQYYQRLEKFVELAYRFDPFHVWF